MEKTIEIENLQSEIARLTAEVENLQKENTELKTSKEYWIGSSERYEKKYNNLCERVKALATMTSGLVDAA